MENNFSTKVSIVIPSYNNFESFKRVLKSVLSQIFQDFEVIVTDDSNNDDIKTYLNELKNTKIKYYKNEPALGAPENWNEGMRKAQGEYIKILHHDDWLADENSLEKFVKLLDNNPDSDFGYAKSADIDTQTGKIKTRHAEKYVKRLEKDPFELFLTNRIGAPSVTIIRNGNDLFYDKNLKWVVDVEFYINCLVKNSKIAFLNETLINIGISNTQVTKSCQNNEKIEVFEQFYLYDKYKTHLTDKKYSDALINLLKEFKIEKIDYLKELLTDDIEIPEKIVKYLSKGQSWLKKLFHS